MEDLLRHDYQTAIMLDYPLDQRILSQAKDTKAMLTYLPEVYEVIVKPMTQRLK